MDKNLKEFYGDVSLAARISFFIKAEDKEKAESIVFNDIEGIELALKDGSTLEISGIDWDLISEATQGNVMESHIDNFEIQEES